MRGDHEELHTCPWGHIKSNKEGRIWSEHNVLLRIIATGEPATPVPLQMMRLCFGAVKIQTKTLRTASYKHGKMEKYFKL